MLAIADGQRNLVTPTQLTRLGLSREAVRHRERVGRLHRVRNQVYSVGSPRIDLLTEWLAAVLACGEGAALSHENAAAVWGLRPKRRGPIHVSVPALRNPREPGVVVHRRARLDVEKCHDIPVTGIVLTLIDIAWSLSRAELERAISEADKLGLIDPESLRRELEAPQRLNGAGKLKRTLDHPTFTVTDSELERLFVPIALRAGLDKPLTRQTVRGYRVDFYWPDLKLVVETDGLTYHRTPAQQMRDRKRDQDITAAGLTMLRFARAQVKWEPSGVEETLRAVAKRP